MTQPLTHPLLEPGAAREEDHDTSPSQGVTHAGAMPMLSTPAMIGLMEGPCLRLLQEKLKPPVTSVGTLVNVRHLAPCPAGRTVRVRAAFVKCDGRRYTFEVQAFCGEIKIGEGFHERVVIDPARYQARGSGEPAP